MGEFVGFVMVIGIFFTVLTAGFGMGQAQAVQSKLTQVVNPLMSEMQVQGGWVHNGAVGAMGPQIAQFLQNEGLSPSNTTITVSFPPLAECPGPSSGPVYYGCPMTLGLTYQLSLSVVGIPTPFTVPVGDSSIGVSSCPYTVGSSVPSECAGNSTAPSSATP